MKKALKNVKPVKCEKIYDSGINSILMYLRLPNKRTCSLLEHLFGTTYSSTNKSVGLFLLFLGFISNYT